MKMQCSFKKAAITGGLFLAMQTLMGSAQAFLQDQTLASGLTATVDTQTQVAWRAFDDPSVGLQAGFTYATVADVDALLQHQGYRPPYVPGPTYTTSTVNRLDVTVTDASTGQILPVETLDPIYLEDRAALDAEYANVLQDPTLPSVKTRLSLYERSLTALGTAYGYSVATQVVTDTVTTVAQPVEDASWYTYNGIETFGGGANGFRLSAWHAYTNYLPGTADRHEHFLAKVKSGDAFWVVDQLDAYNSTYSCTRNPDGSILNCNGRNSTSVYLGPEVLSPKQVSDFQYTDGALGALPMGYLMVQSVPEPDTWALMGLGLCGLAWRVRRSSIA
jgi:hypothetical protein